MPNVISSGTQAATIGTEHALVTDTTNKVYVLVVDTAAMASGDVLELRIKTIVLSAGTERIAYFTEFRNAQPTDDVIKYSVPVPADISFKATLKQTAGTGRSFPWKVLSI